MSSWANGNVLHCYVSDLSLITNCSVPRQARPYSASEMHCWRMSLCMSTEVVFPSWLYGILPSYNDAFSCVGTISQKNSKANKGHKAQSSWMVGGGTCRDSC